MLSINFKNKQFTLTFDLGEYLGRSHQCKVILRKTLLNLKKQLWIKTVFISYKTSMLHWIAIPTIFKTLDNHCSWRTFDRRIFVTDFGELLIVGFLSQILTMQVCLVGFKSRPSSYNTIYSWDSTIENVYRKKNSYRTFLFLYLKKNHRLSNHVIGRMQRDVLVSLTKRVGNETLVVSDVVPDKVVYSQSDTVYTTD